MGGRDQQVAGGGATGREGQVMKEEYMSRHIVDKKGKRESV
jgi:hypothetical protein